MPSYAPGWPRPGGPGVAQVKEGSPFSFSSISGPVSGDAVLPQPGNATYYPKGSSTDFYFIWGLCAANTHATPFQGSLFSDFDDPAQPIGANNFLLFSSSKSANFSMMLPQPVKLPAGAGLKVAVNSTAGTTMLTIYFTGPHRSA